MYLGHKVRVLGIRRFRGVSGIRDIRVMRGIRGIREIKCGRVSRIISGLSMSKKVF